MTEPFFEFDHAAASTYLRQKPKWLYAAVSRREIRHARVGGKLFYKQSDLDAYLKNQIREVRSPRRPAPVAPRRTKRPSR